VKKQEAQLIIMAALLMVAPLAFHYYMEVASSAKAAQAAPELVPQEEAQVKSAIEYTGKGSRDPFTKKTVESAQAAATTAPPVKKEVQLTLKGIIWSPTPVAIINDKVVGIGKEIEGAKVLEIKSTGVKISVDGEESTLKLKRK